MTEDMIKAATGWQPSTGARTGLLIGASLVVLTISTAITWNYGSGHKGVRFYERLLKGMVWMIIVTFAIVVIRRAVDGGIEWRKVARGFLPLELPTDKQGVSIVMAAFAAVVGINSTFIFPYTLLARGWGKEHRGLSRFDLITGVRVVWGRTWRLEVQVSLPAACPGNLRSNSLEVHGLLDRSTHFGDPWVVAAPCLHNLLHPEQQ